MKFCLKKLSVFFAIVGASAAVTPLRAQTTARPADPANEHVLLVMTDGLRWQEVFRGADPSLLTKANNDNLSIDSLVRQYVRSTPQQARAALMPFLWSHIVPEGEIYGNRDKDSDAHVTNGFNFSYPGYNETLTGHADPRINSNDPTPNPNVTVFEWLNKQPGLTGKTAAFGAWSVIADAFNRERCGFTDNAGFDPLTSIPITPRLDLLNHLKAETPRLWDDETFDASTFYTSLEYIEAKHPRLFYLSLGDTDELAHAGSYGRYLEAANRVDQYLQRLWEFVQSNPDYRDHTTLILLTDHGRGDAPVEWKSHGQKIPASKYIFIAAMGPGIPHNGEVSGGSPVTQSQIAATVAKLVGKDWNKQTPAAGQPLPGILVSH
ncbi:MULTISPECIES: alkaline phosphatase family protein [Acidobacteriaceae]|uniref:alkaline phosphatase family protein n=1 Tax=Acidobacteriaceae TaxID=204434 RepID=UPI00131BEA5A|nr:MULTISPECIES: alkaline phosphatase family protein [Acidobacteriaceae]MDW5267876.1 alkaline phosphatase family protein [Edaphobacter sp.]